MSSAETNNRLLQLERTVSQLCIAFDAFCERLNMLEGAEPDVNAIIEGDDVSPKARNGQVKKTKAHR